jgi:hypothetical protein
MVCRSRGAGGALGPGRVGRERGLHPESRRKCWGGQAVAGRDGEDTAPPSPTPLTAWQRARACPRRTEERSSVPRSWRSTGSATRSLVRSEHRRRRRRRLGMAGDPPRGDECHRRSEGRRPSPARRRSERRRSPRLLAEVVRADAGWRGSEDSRSRPTGHGACHRTSSARGRWVGPPASWAQAPGSQRELLRDDETPARLADELVRLQVPEIGAKRVAP